MIPALINNESLAQCNVPDDWRHANVSPVFKKGEKYGAANYRPVSLTYMFLKTLEHSRSRRDVMSHVIYLTTRPPLMFGGKSSDKLSMKRNQ